MWVLTLNKKKNRIKMIRKIKRNTINHVSTTLKTVLGRLDQTDYFSYFSCESFNGKQEYIALIENYLAWVQLKKLYKFMDLKKVITSSALMQTY